MTLVYWDKTTDKQVSIELPAVSDCVLLKVPARDGQPALRVHVSDDAVSVEDADGDLLLGRLAYADLLEDAAKEDR